MLLQNTVFNLVGLGAPLLAAICTIPMLIEGLGEAGFGALALIWAVVGYFGLFDLGLGRALTMRLAESAGRRNEADTGQMVGTAIVITTSLGIASGIILILFSGPVISRIQGIPDMNDASGALFAMACALPFVVVTSCFRGILEANGDFLILNALRLPIGLFTFIGPWVLVFFGQTKLELIGGVLAAGRITGCVAHGWFALRSLPRGIRVRPSFSEIGPLLTAGGWMTVSNVVSPLMNYADRFVIGVIASATAVTFYTTPQEIVTKIWIVPAAVTAVLFPRIAEAGIARFRDRMRHTIWQSIATMVVFIYPPLLIMGLFAKKILSLWISPDFAAQSYFLLQYFAIGMLVNVPANIPLTILQGVGRAKSVALVHLAELPLSLTLTWWLVSEFSLAGAGLSWLLRCVVDTMLMFWLARKLIFGSEISFTGPGFSIRMLAAILGLIPFVAMLTPNLFIKGLFTTTGIVVCAIAGYKIWVNRTRAENVIL